MQHANYNMLTYKKIIPGQIPDLAWYDPLPLTEGRTYRTKQRVCRELHTINTTNSAGQEGNVVRSVGTDNVNKELIQSNMDVNGLLVSVQPGYIFNDDLFDGFTRFNSMLDLGWLHGIFNDLELKEGFTVEEMRDEIGLGANNHPPSKSATINDFKKRLNGYISSYKSHHNVLPTTGNCIDWVNNIPHSFVQKQVIDMVDLCLKSHRCTASVVAFDYAKTNTFAAKHCNDPLNTIPLNVSAQKGGGLKGTYFDRAFIKSLYAGGELSFLGYTQGIEAEEIGYFRGKAQDILDAANKAFEEAFQRRLKQGESFKMFSLEGFVPQIIGEEDPKNIIK